jgi:hypothetical protein
MGARIEQLGEKSMKARISAVVLGAMLAMTGQADRAAAQAAGASKPQIVKTMFRRSPTRDFVRERSFIVNRGNQLHSYQVRFEFSPRPRIPIGFQTFTCVARSASNQRFQFAYRNQTIPSTSAQSEIYFLIVPISDLQSAVCQVSSR